MQGARELIGRTSASPRNEMASLSESIDLLDIAAVEAPHTPALLRFAFNPSKASTTSSLFSTSNYSANSFTSLTVFVALVSVFD